MPWSCFLARIIANVVASRFEGRSRYAVEFGVVIAAQIILGMAGVMIYFLVSLVKENFVRMPVGLALQAKKK